ncbi:hypothetical protein EI427_23900 [Flammeovirga pectinis]|uniref:Uncharacterized protein n=1 Tax=Flammeovirga pectinis TaxID=2494373 RepID=A0A3S9PAL0_9BACT|nr:hypothetical protein [Flammeovirga pectinis]AZQ65261.1 hypothetical protein EI427_23900 [Flammeovirga pectinis]
MKTDKLHIVLNILCAGVILFNAFSVSLLKLDLERQRAFIEKVFCINKDKPEMSCHGQCFISKELEKEAKKQQQTSEQLSKEYVLDLPVVRQEFVGIHFTDFEEQLKVTFPEVTLTSKELLDRALRPPIFSV